MTEIFEDEGEAEDEKGLGSPPTSHPTPPFAVKFLLNKNHFNQPG